ncbi:hypothetical protein BJ165DRAFT_704787 [Panaeolus papilionaceus]|nr:hypothetical protein BJ165DRAFT_704787 [Panaeolus papilionaceus]
MAYRLVNINNGVPCYLLDTPGLADNRISEMSIILQIQEWMKANAVYSLNAILYFDRITDIRMPSSKRRTIQLFKTLMGEDAARSVTIATTMWDQLWNEKQEGAAESRFEELKEHWKGFIAVDSAILRFMNTRESAMEILDCCLKREGYWAFEYLAPTAAQGRPSDYNHNRDKPFGLALYQNLCNRIEELERQRIAVEFDLNQDDTEANAELAEILVQRRTEITMDLQRFEQELRDFLDTLPPVTKYPRIKGRWHRRYDSVMKPTKWAIRSLADVPATVLSFVRS